VSDAVVVVNLLQQMEATVHSDARGESFEVTSEDVKMFKQEVTDEDDEPTHPGDTIDGRTGRPRSRRTQGSLVWKYFLNRRSGAMCKLCKKLLKRSGGNTSNLLQHMKRLHRKQYASLMEEHGRRKMEAATRNMVCQVLLQCESKILSPEVSEILF